ncbi:MAG TPA: hypothetical protein V6D02_03860 [Candidatus Obscuribacterales bacterium]
MEKIKTQANKVSELVFAADTGSTYQKTLTLTWNILRETGVLVWLVLCLVFVGGEWFWKNSVSLGRKARDWYNDLQTPSTTEPKSVSAMGQSALTALGSGAETLLYNAKKQLGMEAVPPTPKAVATPPVATSPPAAPAAVAAAAAPVAPLTPPPEPTQDLELDD